MDAVGLMFPVAIGIGAGTLVETHAGAALYNEPLIFNITAAWDVGYIAQLHFNNNLTFPGCNNGTIWFTTNASLEFPLSSADPITISITPTNIQLLAAANGLSFAVCLFRLDK